MKREHIHLQKGLKASKTNQHNNNKKIDRKNQLKRRDKKKPKKCLKKYVLHPCLDLK